MKTLQYICLKCGNSIEIEYNLNDEQLWIGQSKDCPKCKTPVNNKRVGEIIHDLLNPPINNPTQEYYTDKEIHDKPTEQK